MTDAAASRVNGRVTLTPDDGGMLLRAARTHVGFFNQGRLLLYSAGASWIAAILAYDGSHRTTLLFLALSVALFVAALLAGGRMRRAFGARHGHGQERDIAVDEAGVTVAEPAMRVEYGWSRFDRAFEGRDYFVLHSAADSVALPKRAFADEDLARVRAAIAQRLKIEPIA